MGFKFFLMYICGTIFIDFVSVHTETANPRAMVEMGQLGKKELYFN